MPPVVFLARSVAPQISVARSRAISSPRFYVAKRGGRRKKGINNALARPMQSDFENRPPALRGIFRVRPSGSSKSANFGIIQQRLETIVPMRCACTRKTRKRTLRPLPSDSPVPAVRQFALLRCALLAPFNPRPARYSRNSSALKCGYTPNLCEQIYDAHVSQLFGLSAMSRHALKRAPTRHA